MSLWDNDEFGLFAAADITSILEEPDCTVGKVLEQDELLQEVKSRNERLVHYLTEPENFRTMMTCLLAPAPPGAEDNIKYKQPFMASEVLCCRVPQILDMLMSPGDTTEKPYPYLVSLLNALDFPEPLSPHLIGYIDKVFSMVAEINPVTLLKVVMLGDPEHMIGRFVKHLYSPAVVNLFQTVLHLPFLALPQISWIGAGRLTDQLLEALAAPSELAHGSSDVLVALIRHATITLVASGTAGRKLRVAGLSVEVIEQLVAPEHSAKLFAAVTQYAGQASGHGIHAAEVLAALVHAVTMLKDQTLLIAFSTTLLPWLSQAQAWLSSVKSGPFGVIRLRVLQVVADLSGANNAAVASALQSSGVLKEAVRAFEAFPTNSLLHKHVINVVESIMEGGNPELQLHLVQDCGTAAMLARLLSAPSSSVVRADAEELLNAVHVASIKAPGSTAIAPYLRSVADWDTVVADKATMNVARGCTVVGGVHPDALGTHISMEPPTDRDDELVK